MFVHKLHYCFLKTLRFDFLSIIIFAIFTRYTFYVVIYLFFLVPPRIAPFNFDEPIYSGQSTQVTCLVSEGDTPLNISWWFQKSDNSKLVPLPSGVSVNKMGSKLSMLFIETASSYFVGSYACVVENRAGSSKYTSALNVHGKMVFFFYPCKPNL